MKGKFASALSLALILAMLFTSIGLADDVWVDGDSLAPVVQNALDLGNVCVGNTATGSALIAVRRQGNTNSDNVFASSTIVTVSVGTVSGAGLSATMNADGSVLLPSNWTNLNTGTSADTASSKVTLNSTGLPLGPYSGTITYNGNGTNADSSPTTISRTGNLTVNANIQKCVSVDGTGPVITPSVSGTLGLDNWYTSDVTVSWSVVDDESAISSSSGCDPVTINADTAGTTLTCTATSAGGTSSQSVTIKRDSTAPTGVSGAPNRSPDNGTWYNHAVDVAFTGSDTPSGIASCTTTSYSGPDGSGVNVNGTCTDNAGNTSDPVSSNMFNYDGTAPTNVALSVTAGTAGTNGWYTSDVTIHTSSDNDVSGVTCTGDQFQTTETVGATFNGSCTNGAGLTTNAAPLTVKLDKSGPSAALAVTAGTAGANGWYVSDVTVSTSGSDLISSPVTCTAEQYQTSDTSGTAFNGSCINDAGLTTNASPLTIKRDATRPTLSPSVSPNPVVQNGSATASANAYDATSGVASSSCDAVDTSTIGSQSVTCYATDNAGNSNSGSATYSVVYNWTGFFQPIDNNMLNTTKAGSAIPVKFSLSGNQGLSIFAAGYPSSKVVACGATAEDAIETTVTAGGSSLSYDPITDQYIYVWKTDKAWVGTCRTLVVKLVDGTFHYANFKFK